MRNPRSDGSCHSSPCLSELASVVADMLDKLRGKLNAEEFYHTSFFEPWEEMTLQGNSAHGVRRYKTHL